MEEATFADICSKYQVVLYSVQLSSSLITSKICEMGWYLYGVMFSLLRGVIIDNMWRPHSCNYGYVQDMY